MILSYRQFQRKNRPLARFTLGCDRAPMCQHELFGDRQPQPTVSFRPCAGPIPPPETVENVGQVFGEIPSPESVTVMRTPSLSFPHAK